MAQSLLNNKIPTVYNLASFIGFIVSNFPAVKYGQLHYRNEVDLPPPPKKIIHFRKKRSKQKNMCNSNTRNFCF